MIDDFNEKDENYASMTIEEQMRSDAFKRHQASMQESLDSFFEKNAPEEYKKAQEEENQSSEDENTEDDETENNDSNSEEENSNEEQNNNEPSEAEKLKQELALIKAEKEAERKQAEADKELMQRALAQVVEMQKSLLEEKNKKTTPVVETPKVDLNEEIKKKSQVVVEKALNADATFNEDLVSLMNDVANSKKTLTAEEVEAIFEKRMQAKEAEAQRLEAERYEKEFMKVNNEFFSTNKEILDDPVKMRLFKGTFEDLRADYINKGVLPSPKELYSKAKEVFDSDIEKLVGKKVNSGKKEVKVAGSLQEESSKSQSAKDINPKNQTAAKVDKNTKASEKFDPLALYRNLLAGQGVNKF